MACPRAGDREALDSSRHRMTAGFRSEGGRQRGILLQVGRGPGWGLGGPGCAPAVVRMGSACWPDPWDAPSLLLFWVLASLGFQLSVWSCLQCSWERGVSLSRREQRQRSLALPDQQASRRGADCGREAVTDEPLNPLASPLIPRLTAGQGRAGEGVLAGVTSAGLL